MKTEKSRKNRSCVVGRKISLVDIIIDRHLLIRALNSQIGERSTKLFASMTDRGLSLKEGTAVGSEVSEAPY